MKVAGIPLTSISAVICLIFFVLLEYFFLTNSLYGANIPAVYEAIAFSLAVPIIIFVASYYYCKSKGIDLSLAFREIPPE